MLVEVETVSTNVRVCVYADEDLVTFLELPPIRDSYKGKSVEAAVGALLQLQTADVGSDSDQEEQGGGMDGARWADMKQLVLDKLLTSNEETISHNKARKIVSKVRVSSVAHPMQKYWF